METKKRKHIIVDKVPEVAAIVLMIIGMVLPSAIANPIAEALGGSEAAAGQISRGVVAILVSLIMMALYIFWFKPEFKGNLGKDGLAKGLKLLIPFIIVWTVYHILNAKYDGDVYDFADLAVWTSGFAAGVTEEVAFRGLAVSTLLRKYNSAKNVWLPGVIVGVLFGVVHLANLTAGDEVTIVLLTTVFAIGGGLLFGAIYTYCGNLWPAIIAHGLYDSVSFAIIEDPNEPVEYGALTYAQIAIMFVLGILAIILIIKRSKEVSDLWQRKWSINE